MSALYEIGVLLFCLFYIYSALRIPFGTLAEPGPGFFPLILAFLGLAVSLALLVSTLWRRPRTQESGSGEKVVPATGFGGGRDLIVFVAAIVVFGLCFETVGVVLGLIILTVALCRICGLEGWRKPLVVGVVTSLSVYAVFALIFKIPMPNGPLDLLF